VPNKGKNDLVRKQVKRFGKKKTFWETHCAATNSGKDEKSIERLDKGSLYPGLMAWRAHYLGKKMN